MLPLLYCEDVLTEFCAVAAHEAFRISAPYGKDITFEALCVLGRCNSACQSLRTSKSLQRTITTVRKHLVVQLVRHPSWSCRSTRTSTQSPDSDSSLSVWNLVKAGDMLNLRQYLAAGFLVHQTRLIHSHNSHHQAPHTQALPLPREFSGLHCAWMTQASPEIIWLLLMSGTNPDVDIMPDDSKCYYSATELKRERFLREHPLRPSAMQQAGAMSLSNELPMHLCFSLCAQGSCIHVTDKDRGSIGLIQCPPHTPVTQTKDEPGPDSTHADCSITAIVTSEEITDISPILSSSSEDVNVRHPRSRLDIGAGLNLCTGGGRAQLPPELEEKVEAILAKNRQRTNERSYHHDRCDEEPEMKTKVMTCVGVGAVGLEPEMKTNVVACVGVGLL